MKSMLVRYFVLSLLFAGCATPRATLQVQALRVGQQVPNRLAVEGTLRTGDQFLLQVDVPQAAYVYALRPTRTQAERFFPESGHIQALPGTSLYIPGPGSYLTLGDGKGREFVFVVVSVRQLDDAVLQDLVRNKSGIRARGISGAEETTPQSEKPDGGTSPQNEPPKNSASAPEAKKEDPPPPEKTGPLDRPGRKHVVEARLDSRHDAVLTFIFNHEPADSSERKP